MAFHKTNLGLFGDGLRSDMDDHLVGNITTERLRQWRDEHAGRPNAGQARMLIKSLETGHATMQQVSDAILRYERITDSRQARHARQVWVSPRLQLVDGQWYDSLRVWNPERGEFILSGRFVAKAPRGAASYHVMSRDLGAEFSTKRGSFVEVRE